MSKNKILSLLSCIALHAFAHAQIQTETVGIPISSIREDVRAIGMGKTQIANGTQFNAMMYNPALLANTRSSFDLPSIQTSLPSESFSAVSFLADNLSQFTKGTFVKDINGGVADYRAAQTDDARLAALRRIQSGLRFISDLQDKVGGTTDDPKVHGLSAAVSFQGQVGNFGFAVYGVGQTAFTVYSSQAVSALAKVNIPQGTEDITVETLAELAAAADALLNPDGTPKDGAAPTALAVSYSDLVVATGYGDQLTDELSLGGNLKLVTRSFSSKLIEPGNYNKIWKELREDFENSVTGLTVDVGAMYKFKKAGTQIGASIQNIIPVGRVSSKLSWTNYSVDENGNAAEQIVTTPFELELPLIVNIGATHPMNENWDISLDVTDLASQDEKYEEYVERLRVGTEYRLQTTGWFGAAFRGGLADKRPTVGLGLHFGRSFQIDAAYAYDNYVEANSYFAQIRFGW